MKEAAKYAADQAKSADKRAGEAAEVVRIIQSQLDPANDRFVILGDLNDTPDSPALAALTGPANPLGLTNATSILPQADVNPGSPARRPRDTHLWNRFDPVEKKQKKTWAQIDHILCSPALWALSTGDAKVINSPQNQGSDHYISYAKFDAPPGLSI